MAIASQVAATQVSREQAREEIGKVLLAEEDLSYFAEYVSDGWYTAYAMHHLIAHKLHQVLRYLETDGKEGINRLMIFTPIQHGKSELVSRMFPAFALGKLPNLRVSLISYGESLASGSSRAVRNMVMSDRYQPVFGTLSPGNEQVQLSKDSRSVTSWDLAPPHRGGMMAAGVSGAVTGKPKGLFIIDDPIKDHREAQSEAVREDVWDFYKSAVRGRAVAIVLIMTRWHPDDLAGKLLKQMVNNPDTDQWDVLDLPGLTEEGLFASSEDEQIAAMKEGMYMSTRDALGREMGEVLCPAMLSKKEMLKIRAGDEFYFTALYQQRPYLKEGQRYKREWFEIINELPEDVRIVRAVRAWDKANSKMGDYTAGVLFGKGSDGFFYKLDVVRGRWSSFERDQVMLKTAKADQEKWGHVTIWHQQDPGNAGKDSAEATSRVLVGFPVFYEPMTGSKESRSEPLESAYQAGLVKLLRGAWNGPMIEEYAAFNKGKYDDQVDAGSMAFSKLQVSVNPLDMVAFV